MSDKKRSVAAGLGLGAATLLAAQSADAATEIATVAASDGRAGLLFLPLLAALGWVGFNILPGLQVRHFDAYAFVLLKRKVTIKFSPSFHSFFSEPIGRHER